MYFQFYGFKEPPFNLTPNSRVFFASQKHQEALDSLLYAVDNRKGFVVITGEIGSGKTTVCRTLLNKLNKHTEVADDFFHISRLIIQSQSIKRRHGYASCHDFFF